MKSQVFSLDLLIAVGVFLVAFGLLVQAWNVRREKLLDFEEITSMQRKAYDVADMLIRTSGNPEEWNTSNVESIGLVEESHIFSEEKILSFLSLGYGNAKLLLGLENDFYFEMAYVNGTPLRINDTMVKFGLSSLNASEVVSVQRLGLFNNETVKMIFGVWK